MAVLLTRLEWYPDQGSGSMLLLDDYLSISVRKGAEPKSNSAEIVLKNSLTKRDTANLSGYIDPEGNLKFQQGDIIKIFAKHSEDGSDIDTSDDSLDLLMVSELKEIDLVLEEGKSQIKLKCVDRTYTLLNRLWGRAYQIVDTAAPNGEGWTAPEIIQNVIRSTTDNSTKPTTELFADDGTKGTAISEGKYEIDARLFTDSIISTGTTTSTSSMKLIDSGATFISDGISIGDQVYNSTDRTWSTVASVDSETQLTLTKDIFVSGEDYDVGDGFIQDKRPNLGTADTDTSLFPDTDSTNFPFKAMGKSFKPVYEWINDLSQIENTNTLDEANNEVPSFTLVVRRPMRYYVDESYRFHWFYPDTTPELYMTEGTITAISPDTSKHLIYSIKGKKAVYDVVNFVIFRAGTDMYGAQILGYYQDSNVTERKDTYRAYVSISERMKEADYKAGNLQRTTSGDQRAYDFPSSYPVTPVWDDEGRAVANDTAYNDNFRDIAAKRGRDSARSLVFQRSNPRWKLDVRLRGENLVPADLIRFNSNTFGLVDLDLRINDINHQISKQSWQTTITIEEDEEEKEQ